MVRNNLSCRTGNWWPPARPPSSFRASAHNPKARSVTASQVVYRTIYPAAHSQSPIFCPHASLDGGTLVMLATNLRPGALRSLGPRGSNHRGDGDGVGVRETNDRLSGGALNAALANELGKLIADFTGR